MTENSGLQIVEIEVTNRCNLNCKHCYRDQTKLCDLDSKKIFSLIDEVSELGVYRLVFTGGEPLLLKKVFEYAKYAKEKKIPQLVLMTNGILVSKNNLKDLKIFDLIQLSIDVPPGIKPYFRKNYLKDLEKTIELLKKENIKVHLQATLHRALIPHLENLSKFAEEKKVTLGLNRLILAGNSKELYTEKLTPKELKDALSKVTKCQKSNPSVLCSDILLFLVNKKRMNLFKESKQKQIIGGCIAGISTLYIKSNGEVLICPFVDHPISNVLEKPLKKIWFENDILKKLRDRSNIQGKCSKCKYLSYCGGCRGDSLNETGSLFNSDSNCWLN